MYKAAAIQMKSIMGNISYNMRKAIKLIHSATSQGANLIALPELFLSGYHLNEKDFVQAAKYIKNSTIIAEFQSLAKELKVVLLIPYPELDNNQLFISCAVINNDGMFLGVYRKSFLWDNEKITFSKGPFSYPVFQTGIGTIGVLICYDIEFPEPARLLALQGAELIIVPSVWSIVAESRWDIQLPARALDNQCFVMGINTIDDGACGKSRIIDPSGAIMSEATKDSEGIIFSVINHSETTRVKEQLPYMKDFPLQLTPGGYIKNK